MHAHTPCQVVWDPCSYDDVEAAVPQGPGSRAAQPANAKPWQMQIQVLRSIQHFCVGHGSSCHCRILLEHHVQTYVFMARLLCQFILHQLAMQSVLKRAQASKEG